MHKASKPMLHKVLFRTNCELLNILSFLSISISDIAIGYNLVSYTCYYDCVKLSSQMQGIRWLKCTAENFLQFIDSMNSDLFNRVDCDWLQGLLTWAVCQWQFTWLNKVLFHTLTYARIIQQKIATKFYVQVFKAETHINYW